MNRLDVGEQHLREAIALDASVAQAHASWHAVDAAEKEAARESLERAVSLNSSNYLAHYYAYALSLQGRGEGGLHHCLSAAGCKQNAS
ncbi:MAG: hypothetical protein WKF84_00270 [Pyrinomonadaceae bacterium]